MNYYKLKFGFDRTQEIGRFPQASEVKSIAFNTSEVLAQQTLIDGLVPPEPILDKAAKRTTLLDVVSLNSSKFLVFKNYFIEFLNDFNIGHCPTWPMKVHHKKEVLNEYLLFHISYSIDDKIVSYADSEFLVGKLGDWRDPSIRNPINVKSHKNYLSLVEVLKESSDNSQIRCNKLVLDFKNIEIDMFRLIDIPIGSGYYVSERLRDAILEKRFTGMDFIPIETYSPRISVKK